MAAARTSGRGPTPSADSTRWSSAVARTWRVVAWMPEHEGGQTDHRGEEAERHGLRADRPLHTVDQVPRLLDIAGEPRGDVLARPLGVVHEEPAPGGADSGGVVPAVVEAQALPLVGGHVEVGPGERRREHDARYLIALVLGTSSGNRPMPVMRASACTALSAVAGSRLGSSTCSSVKKSTSMVSPVESPYISAATSLTTISFGSSAWGRRPETRARRSWSR